MPSRKSDVRRSDVLAISQHATEAEDSPMTSAPPVSQSESSATPAAAAGAGSGSATFAPPIPTTGGDGASDGLGGPVFAVAESNAGTSEKGGNSKERSERDRDGAVTIEDLNLPKSIITRLAKGVLPPNTQIQANAILAMSKSATVFISHLSNAANEWTHTDNKKTIMPNDVFRALDDIEYGFMRERLEAEFAKFNEVQSTKRSAYRRKVSAAKRAARGVAGGESVADSSVLSTGSGMGDGEDEDAMDETHMEADTTMGTVSAEDGARAAKKARVDTSSDGAKGGGRHGDGEEVSDAETVPDEHVEEEDDDEDDDVEEDNEEEEEEDGGEEEGREDGDERRGGREVEDEALDEDSE